jgi:5-methylcytosine-specific restriction protein A
MSYGFEPGRLYNRRADIHARFGGQQQGGIVTPGEHPLVIIITGEEGLDHGYSDREMPDGSFEYFGEGQVGNMPWVRGNRAIRDHSKDGKSLLLFRKTRQGLRFVAEMLYAGHHVVRAPDTTGAERDAIVFELRPLEAVLETVEAQPVVDAPASLDLLRARALEAADIAPATTAGPRTIYERSRAVRAWVLARAGENCEGCADAAPFRRPDGSPYLEPHHIRRVSDGGPDHPAFVIALCPTCHRRVHAGADGPAYNQVLLGKMSTLEPSTHSDAPLP